MDILHIKALSVATRIGIHAWEQRIDQQLLIDLSIVSDFSDCKDDLTTTLDYDEVCTAVTKLVQSRSFQLIEVVANEVVALVKEQFNVKHLTVAVTKPHAVKNAGAIQVVVNR